MIKNIKSTILLLFSTVIIGASITACGASDNGAATNASTEVLTETGSQDSTESSSETTTGSETAADQSSASASAEVSNSSTMSFDPNTQVQIIAEVKEVRETSLLVTSKTEPYIGDFEVTFDNIEVSGVEPGSEITIVWNGTVLETDPGQLKADAIGLNQ